MGIKHGYIFILITIMLHAGHVSGATDIPAGTQDETFIRSELRQFRILMQNSDPAAGEYCTRIMQYIASGIIDDALLLSDSYYYTGTYKYIENSYDEAVELLEKSVDYRMAGDSIDDTYARARSNLGLSYMYSGKYEQASANLEIALATRERLFGTNSHILLNTLLNLSGLYYEMDMHEKALSVSLRGIRLAESNTEYAEPDKLLKLYHNSGISYMNFLDYSRAKRNMEIAYSLALEHAGSDTLMMLAIYNSLAICSANLGNKDDAGRYFRDALGLIGSATPAGRTANAVFENYAFYLTDNGMFKKADDFLQLSLEATSKEYGRGSRDHILKLLSYSYFLTEYMKDYEQAENQLIDIMYYVGNNLQDVRVKNEALLNYSGLMYHKGRYEEALKYINEIYTDSLVVSYREKKRHLLHRGKILHKMYLAGSDIECLEKSLSAIEEAISIIEDTRLKINEDESRSRVYGRDDDAYTMAIYILSELFRLTGDEYYLERSLVISEKSKAAGLLAATRNNRSINYQLPAGVAELEKELLAEIRDYNEVIYNESASQDPDNRLIDRYKLLNFKSNVRYDSLLQVFEDEYPRYYNLKYNTGVSDADDIRKCIGRDGNFIEYYMSDSLLYIFLVNRNNLVLETVQTGQDFHDRILEFRDILINPSIIKGSREQYEKYIRLSYELYTQLVLPVRDYFISEKLLVSAGGILSYIPFETLISEKPLYDDINYRELAYLLRQFEIVYEYSGTLLSETLPGGRSLRNKVLSFAPDYSDSIDVNDLMMSRKPARENLSDIPGAREEAVYINSILGGDLYIDGQATESSFKANAPSGDIVHMAMHTLLNDNEPMYSKMVFSMEPGQIEDGMLNTYEVFNLSIKAKMLFLSSCNTGSGYLQTGEGVMSLARAFFYSGSPSVIMALWEVDDRSGSDMVKRFYNNINRGYTKSLSLRKARLEYLDNADQMRAHPYFWGALMIMGSDDPVYFPVKRYILIALSLIIIFFLARYYYRVIKP